MQGYLSEMTARWLLAELARTTLLVAALGAAAWLVLRIARVRSPLLHRACCAAVLLAGWSFVRWPVDVAWYEAPPVAAEVVMPGAEAAVAEAAGEPESFTPPIDPRLLSPPPEFGAAMGPPVAVEAQVAELELSEPTVDAPPDRPLRPEPVAVREARPGWNVSPEQAAVAVWLGGIAAVVGWWLFGYVRFMWQLPRGVECLPQWQAEFQTAVEGQTRAGRVEFRVTDGAGPLLCRLPRRTVLLVPRALWQELEAAERRAILRHELEHLRRGDLWKSLAVRGLALVHWFNPVAWLAVRRFDDAAEWACDQAAMASEPTSYAAMLLRLGELAGTRARFGSAMSNRPLTTRIRRLLTPSGMEDSAMKKACLISLLVVMAPLAVVRVNLVAEEPEAKVAQGIEFFVGDSEPESQPAEASTEQPEAKDNLFRDQPVVPVSPEAEDRPSAPERMPVGELGDEKPADDPVKAAQRKMVEFAKKTYEAQDAAYKAGTITLDQVFHWSNLWLSAELAVAESRDEQIAAAERNLARLKVVEANIRWLFEQQARGGEHNAMYAANFYVADAERRLAEIEAMPEPQAKAERSEGNDAMVVAAARGYESTLAAYQSGNATLETVIAWSNRWLAAELEFARSHEEQFAATRAHYRRIRDMHRKIAALYRTGSRGGEAPAMATADYYLADAERRVKEIEQTSPAANAVGQPQPVPQVYAANPYSTAAAPGVAFAPPAEPDPAWSLKLHVMGKWYVWNDPTIVTPLRTMLKEPDSSTLLAAIMATTARPVGGGIEVRTELAPELIDLLGHADPQVQNMAEQALLDMRPEIEAVLQEAAKSKKPEIATRVKSILDRSRPVPAAVGAVGSAAQPPPAVAPAPLAAGETYEDRTFEQWVEIFKAELEPGSRRQSLAALRVFAGNGRGKEVAELLIRTLGPTMPDVESADEEDSELDDEDRARQQHQEQELISLLNYAAATLRRIPRAELLPVLEKVLTEGDTGERRFVLNAVPGDLQQFSHHYLKLMQDRDRTVAWMALAQADKVAAAEVGRTFEAAFQSPNREDRLWAIEWLPALIHMDEAHLSLCRPLVQFIGGDDQEVSNAASEAVLKLGAKARPALSEALQSAEGSAAATIKELLRGMPLQPLEEVAPVVQQPPAAAPIPETPVRPQYYDGKMFGQWRTQLQTDLSPTLRSEAMYAMAEFAAHGHGTDAAKVILDTAREYGPTLTTNSTKKRVQEAAIYAALRVPPEELLPLVIEAFKSEHPEDRLLAIQYFPKMAATPEGVALLELAMRDADPLVAAQGMAFLASTDHDNEALINQLKEILTTDSTRQVPQGFGDAVRISLGAPWRTPLGREVSFDLYPQFVESLVDLMESPNEPVRNLVVSNLRLAAGDNDQALRAALQDVDRLSGDPRRGNARKILNDFPRSAN